MKNIQNDQTSTSGSLQQAKADVAQAKAQRNASGLTNATPSSAAFANTAPTAAGLSNSLEQAEIAQAKQELNTK